MPTWKSSNDGLIDSWVKILFFVVIGSTIVGAIKLGDIGLLITSIFVILVGIAIGIIDINGIIESIDNEVNNYRQRSELQKKKAFEDEQIANGFIKLKDEEGNDTWLSKDEANKLFFDVIKSINEFKHSKNYSSEEGYHAELYGWLKAHFKNAKTEERIGSSKPDISIGNIAIEVKGPTDDNAINTLPAKCLKYLNHYDNLIFVLFNPHFSENNFREIAHGIKKYHPGVIIIRKYSS